MTLAGLEAVTVREVAKSNRYPTLESAYATLVRGSAPLALLRQSLGETAWSELYANLYRRLAEKYGEGEQELTMRANLAVAKKPLD